MGGNSNSKAKDTGSNSSKIFDNFLTKHTPNRPLSKDIPNDLNRKIAVELGEIEDDVVVVSDQGEFKQASEEVSRFQIEVKDARNGNPLPGLDVQVSLIRREDGLRFGPYSFDFLCGFDSFCYSRDLQIPEGRYDLEAIVQPESGHKALEKMVGSVRAVFTGVDVS